MINQTINPYYKYETLNELESIFNSDKVMLELTKTYRSSKEIIEYTNKILGLNFVSAIRNKNNIPVIQKESENIKNDLLEDIFTLKKKYKSIAIITKNDNESKEIYEMLKNDINIDIISTNSNNLIEI